MIGPTLTLIGGIDDSIRGEDEWLDERDELSRIQRILDEFAETEDSVIAAGLTTYLVAKSQQFLEGNMRTAVLAARWILDENQTDGLRSIQGNDLDLAGLLLRADYVKDVGDQVLAMYESRR